MNILKRLGLKIGQFFERRKRATSLKAFEVERLDRIRNPSKYAGK
jgi:hypothetical protein